MGLSLVWFSWVRLSCDYHLNKYLLHLSMSNIPHPVLLEMRWHGNKKLVLTGKRN